MKAGLAVALLTIGLSLGAVAATAVTTQAVAHERRCTQLLAEGIDAQSHGVKMSFAFAAFNTECSG